MTTFAVPVMPGFTACCGRSIVTSTPYTGTPCWIVATGSSEVTLPVIREVAPTASTVTFATKPSFSLATSLSPTVPCSTIADVLASVMNGLAALSPTCDTIDATTPALGAVTTALSRFVWAFCSAVAALSTELLAPAML